MAGARSAAGLAACPGTVTPLLDTHFLIWLVLGSDRLTEFPWLDRYRPWGVSPVSFLEIQFLAEIGRLWVRHPEFTNAVMDDPRWTRDPFDRLLAAHSLARRLPLCSLDRRVRSHHRLVVEELARADRPRA